MGGPKPEKIELSDKVRQELEKLATRHTTGQLVARRARIILKAAEGKNNAEIAREVKQSIDMVRLWRRRWGELEPIELTDLSVKERLEDLPRPGAPPRPTADQMCQMEQMACEGPEKAGRPISQWTGREIADELAARGIVEQIEADPAAYEGYGMARLASGLRDRLILWRCLLFAGGRCISHAGIVPHFVRGCA